VVIQTKLTHRKPRLPRRKLVGRGGEGPSEGAGWERGALPNLLAAPGPMGKMFTVGGGGQMGDAGPKPAQQHPL